MLANMYQHSATLANFSSSCFPLPNHLVHAYIQLFLHVTLLIQTSIHTFLLVLGGHDLLSVYIVQRA